MSRVPLFYWTRWGILVCLFGPICTSASPPLSISARPRTRAQTAALSPPSWVTPCPYYLPWLTFSICKMGQCHLPLRAALRVLGGACAASSSAPFPFFFLLPQLSGEAGDSWEKRREEQVHTLSASLTSTEPRHLLHWKVKKEGVTGCSLQPMDIQSATEITLCFY